MRGNSYPRLAELDPSAHDEAYETTSPACGSRPGFYFRIARTCDFSVGLLLFSCGLSPLTEPSFWLLSDKSQLSQF